MVANTKIVLCLALVILNCTTVFGADAPAVNLLNPAVREAIVAREVERLKNWEGDATERMQASYYETTNSPIKALINVAKCGEPDGIGGIYQLIPYLTNTVATKSTVSSGPYNFLSGERRPVQLNEYIANIIVRVAGHEFYLASGDEIVLRLGDSPLKDPVIIGWFQNQIKHWCSININSSLERRKIADVNDWFHYNRFNAYRWLGTSKSTKGRLPLERRVEYLIDADSLDTMKRSELAACAEALGEIGDRRSVAAVRDACHYIRDYPEYSSFSNYDLFQAYHALATLGEKPAALTELKRYSDEHLRGAEPRTQQEFSDKLKESQSW